MTPKGRKCLQALRRLTNRRKKRQGWFTAQEIFEQFDDSDGTLASREKPVMTISSYLTHLKHADFVERSVSSDKVTAWWRMTKKGKKAIA